LQVAGLSFAIPAGEISSPSGPFAFSRQRARRSPLSKYLLRLFVTSASSRSATAIANLRRICEQELEGQYDLEIIDVLEYPDLAENEKILATPTLIKSLPLPLRRVIGDLSNTEKVLLGLEVHPTRTDASTEGKAR
jgi:circadian clock protein KaiB